MNRILGLTLGIAAMSLSVLVAGTGADRHRQFDQKVEKVDISDLRDGETRTLGKGDKAVTATRKGDQVTLEYGGRDGERKTLQCVVGKDSCYVMTVIGDGKAQVVVVDKSAESGQQFERVMVHEGKGNETKVMVLAAHGAGDEDGDVIVDALPGDMSWVAADGKGATGVKVIRIRGEAATILECPEGDATLTLKKGEEKSGPYFCPKHNVKMEAAKLPAILKKVEVKSDSDDEESD
jgi:hypothetical protein